MEHAALNTAAHRFGIDDQAGVMCADQALGPNVSRLPIHLNFSDHCQNRLSAECITDTAAGQDIPSSSLFCRRTSVPSIGLSRRFDDSERTCPAESVIVLRARIQ